MSRWNHFLCESCYDAAEPGRSPITMAGAGTPCCSCGARPENGAWYRKAPDAFPCGGKVGAHIEEPPEWLSWRIDGGWDISRGDVVSVDYDAKVRELARIALQMHRGSGGANG